MTNNNRRMELTARAAGLMLSREETEYLHAKERAAREMGLPEGYPLPPNRNIKKVMAALAADAMGKDETESRIRRMREFAEEVMTVIEAYDPHLIGSVLHGTIRDGSDVDLHAYGEAEDIAATLEIHGYSDIDLDRVRNLKGEFIHLRWQEEWFSAEVTVYPWSQRHETQWSSVTCAPMKRACLHEVRAMLSRR